MPLGWSPSLPTGGGPGPPGSWRNRGPGAWGQRAAWPRCPAGEAPPPPCRQGGACSGLWLCRWEPTVPTLGQLSTLTCSKGGCRLCGKQVSGSEPGPLGGSCGPRGAGLGVRVTPPFGQKGQSLPDGTRTRLPETPCQRAPDSQGQGCLSVVQTEQSSRCTSLARVPTGPPQSDCAPRNLCPPPLPRAAQVRSAAPSTLREGP